MINKPVCLIACHLYMEITPPPSNPNRWSHEVAFCHGDDYPLAACLVGSYEALPTTTEGGTYEAPACGFEPPFEPVEGCQVLAWHYTLPEREEHRARLLVEQSPEQANPQLAPEGMRESRQAYERRPFGNSHWLVQKREQLQQVEFWFSDRNYFQDKYLLEEASKSPEGWVPLQVLMHFRKLKKLRPNAKELPVLLRYSHLLEVSQDGLMVR